MSPEALPPSGRARSAFVPQKAREFQPRKARRGGTPSSETQWEEANDVQLSAAFRQQPMRGEGWNGRMSETNKKFSKREREGVTTQQRAKADKRKQEWARGGGGVGRRPARAPLHVARRREVSGMTTRQYRPGRGLELNENRCVHAFTTYPQVSSAACATSFMCNMRKRQSVKRHSLQRCDGFE